MSLQNAELDDHYRLRLFLYTLEEYVKVCEKLPINWDKEFLYIDLAKEDVAINIRASLLRKYITRVDSVHLGQVVGSAKIALPSTSSELETVYDRYVSLYNQQVEQSLEDGTILNLRDTFDDIVYGLHLHADVERVERLLQSSGSMRLYSLRIFIQSIEESLFALKDLLIREGVKALSQKTEFERSPSIAVLRQGETNNKSVSGYWSNLYGRDVEDDEAATHFYSDKTTDEMEIIARAGLFLIKLSDKNTTIQDMETILFSPTIADWGDLSVAREFLLSFSKYGIGSAVKFNRQRDTAYVKVFENVDNAFVINIEQIVPVQTITLVRGTDIKEWRVFAFGVAIDPYANRR